VSTLGKEIEVARINKNFTRKALAKKVGLSEKNILDIETGSKIVNSETLKRIAKALDTDFVDNLFSIATIESSSQEKDSYPVTSKRGVPSESVEVVSAFGNLVYNVSIYDYSLVQVFGRLPFVLENNKIEGHAKEKIFALKIMDNSMSGMRIRQDDTLILYRNTIWKEDSISLIRWNNQFLIRKIKKLDDSHFLLLFHDGELKSRKVPAKEIEFLGHAIKNIISL